MTTFEKDAGIIRFTADNGVNKAFEEFNLNTKKAQQFVNNYKYSTAHCLYDVYVAPSRNKTAIERKIIANMFEFNGDRYRVTSHNCQIFSCAYLLVAADSETGECIKYLIYYTPSSRYAIEIPFEWYL